MTKISPNVHIQLQGEPLYVAVDRSHQNDSIRHRFLHIVNPFSVAAGSEGDKIQQLTFRTMELAQAQMPPDSVRTVAVMYPEEDVSIPASFISLKTLQRSAQDVGNFKVKRPLPLLFDILACGLAAAEDRDYVVFTNVDICLMPHFYVSLQRILDLGFESIIVNRRTIAKYGFDPQLLPLMYADYGQSHSGFDCFVFPRRLFDGFVRSDVCVGAPHVMRALMFNLVALTRSLLILRDAHMTFHLGDDKTWQSPEFMDYRDHNQRCTQEVLTAHGQDQHRRELLRSFCLAHNEMFKVP
jgi:hypothetical protein